MKDYYVMAINPGSTSMKFAIYENETCMKNWNADAPSGLISRQSLLAIWQNMFAWLALQIRAASWIIENRLQILSSFFFPSQKGRQEQKTVTDQVHGIGVPLLTMRINS